MKKLAYSCVVALALLMSSCQPTPDDYIQKMNDLIEEIDTEGSDFTSEEWEKVNLKFQELVDKVGACEDLTDEQAAEVVRLQAKYAGVSLKSGGKGLLKDLKKRGKALKDALSGDKD